MRSVILSKTVTTARMEVLLGIREIVETFTKHPSVWHTFTNIFTLYICHYSRKTLLLWMFSIRLYIICLFQNFLLCKYNKPDFDDPFAQSILFFVWQQTHCLMYLINYLFVIFIIIFSFIVINFTLNILSILIKIK